MLMLGDCTGWDIRGGVTRLWAGDHDLENLIVEKDTGSQLALRTILAFAKKFEADFGQKTGVVES